MNSMINSSRMLAAALCAALLAGCNAVEDVAEEPSADLPQQTDRYTLHVIHVTRLASGANLRLTLGRQQFDNFTANDRRASPIDERHDRDHKMQSFEAVATIPEGTRTWVAGTRFEAEHFRQSLTRTSSTSTGLVTTSGPEVEPLSFGTHRCTTLTA